MGLGRVTSDRQRASSLLASFGMRTLYVRNVPDDVGERLEQLADRAGMSLSAFVARELAVVARRADNAALLAGLPDLGVDASSVVDSIESGRAEQ